MTTTPLPILSPTSLGLPNKFTRFRPTQFDTACNLTTSPSRVNLLQAPTGSGKSLTSLTASALYNIISANSTTATRLMYLVGNRGLQRQLMADFETIGRLIWGKSNYLCKDLGSNNTADLGKCNWGAPCEHKQGGCDYYDAQRMVLDSATSFGNYSLWMSLARYSNVKERLGVFDLLVLDEAHTIEKWLGDFCQVVFDKTELKLLLGAPMTRALVESIARGDDMIGGTRLSIHWAEESNQLCREKHRQERLLPRPDTKILFQLTQLARNLHTIAAIQHPANWVIQEAPHRVTFSPIWPTRFVEPYIFQGVSKIILSTAWLPAGHVSRLGLDANNFSTILVPSTFPVHRRPFYFMPTIKVDYKTMQNTTMVRRLIDTFDDFIAPRLALGRKGIIQVHSYKGVCGAETVLKYSRFRHLMLANKRSEDLAKTLYEFEHTTEPAILLSPSVKAGYDFPDDQCRYQIIVKMPWLPMNDPLVKARSNSYKQYLVEEAALDILQMVGRPVRSVTDWCETITFDIHFKRVFHYLTNNAPKSFTLAISWRDTLPQPMVVRAMRGPQK